MIRLNKLMNRCFLPLALVLLVATTSLLLHVFLPPQRVLATQAVPQVELPIVMYHHMLKEQSRLNKYTISPDEFRQDMQYIKENGYTPITLTALIASVQNGTELPAKPIIITFDDGYESFYTYAYPILQEYGYKAVFSVVGAYADQYSAQDDHHIRYSHCTWEQLKEMQDGGLVEVQNHSYNLHVNKDGRHGAKKKQGEADEPYRKVLLDDIGRMQQACYEYLGVYPNTFTYPFGQISKEALPLLKEMGFQAALICQEKLNYLTGDPEQLYHLNRFNRAHGDSLQSIIGRARVAPAA